MKNSINNIVSLTTAGCLGLLLTACGGSSSTDSNYGGGTSSYYSGGSTQQWGDYLSVIGGFSNGLTGYSTPYVDMSYVPNDGLNGSGYAWGYGDYGSYKFQSKQVQHKLINGICESGSVDADLLPSDYAVDDTLVVTFNQCKTSMGVLNGSIEQEVIGDLGGFDSSPSGAADVYTKYGNLSIDSGVSSFTLNGTIIQYLEWGVDYQFEKTSSNDLSVSVVDSEISATFEFSDFRTTVTADLSSNPGTYSLTEDFTAYVSSSDYNGSITLVTEEPVVSSGGAVISEGKQVLTDSSGQQVVFKKQ